MCTPLCFAAELNQRFEVIEALLTLGADVNGTGKRMGPCDESCNEECSFHENDMSTVHSPIIFAVKNNRRDLVKLFLNHDVNLNVRDGNNYLPIELACENGNSEIVALLLPHFTPTNHHLLVISVKFPNILSTLIGREGFERYYDMTLYWASEENQEESIKILLDAGAKTEYAGSIDRTALFEAVRNKNKSAVKMLIEAGANVNAVGSDKLSVLQVAIHEDKDIVSILLKHGAKVERDTYTLKIASIFDNTEVLEILRDIGINFNCKFGHGDTALTTAVSKGSYNATKFLLENGADVNLHAQCNATPLHWAVQIGRIDIVELLVDNGADINALGYENRTPITYSIYKKRDDITKYLMEHGAIKPEFVPKFIFFLHNW